MTAELLRTERLRVRDWRHDDAERFFDVYRRWEVARWLGATPQAMTDPAEASSRIARWASRNAERPGEGIWAVERLEDGVVAGTVLLVPLSSERGELEVGWHFHPDSWGHGYATESAAALLEATFDRGVAEVFAVVRPGNDASQAVCRRLGMERLGLTDRYYDSELELFRVGPGRPHPRSS